MILPWFESVESRFQGGKGLQEPVGKLVLSYGQDGGTQGRDGGVDWGKNTQVHEIFKTYVRHRE